MMDPMNYFVFDGVPSTDFQMYTNGNQTFGSPEADMETVTIPGKSGDLLRFGNRFANTEVAYDCWIAANMRENIRALRSFLLTRTTYKRLEDTYHPDEFRLAVYSGGLNPDVSIENTLAEFTLTFNCKPQRFLKSGEETIECSEPSVLVYNPSYCPSKPLIRIYGNGTLVIGNRQIVTTNNASSYIDFDCEIMDAFTGTYNRNSDIQTTNNDFITIPAGKSIISKTEGITSFEIIPRWFYL